jgi:hydantoinase/carbamoylase family amidase
MRYGTELMRQADVLALFSEDPPQITRIYLSEQHKQAGEYLIGLMRRAGMTAGCDALGNIVGRYEAADPNAPVVMTGSHQDSVRNAGKYDGLFGIITAIACVKDLHDRGKRLPYTLEVVGFCDEEGVRFGATLIGSKAMAGSFEPAWLDNTDDKGVTMRQALIDFGGNPGGWQDVDRHGKNVVAYVESHIEQGPVLLNDGLPVGVVTAIAGASRLRVRVTGLAGHAGTVPMGSRQDALTAASEMVLFVERYCEGKPGLVGTVGKMAVLPGAINVIPQDVEFTIDVRSGDDALRREAVTAFQSGFDDIAKRRNVTVSAAPFYAANAAPCDAALQEAFARAIAAHGIKLRHLPSGAGHDAMVFPALAPTAMLFVRCGNNGISHHPDETMTAEDADIATSVLLHFFENYRYAP